VTDSPVEQVLQNQHPDHDFGRSTETTTPTTLRTASSRNSHDFPEICRGWSGGTRCLANADFDRAVRTACENQRVSPQRGLRVNDDVGRAGSCADNINQPANDISRPLLVEPFIPVSLGLY